MSERTVHFSRLLDIVNGYFGASKKELPKLAKDFESFKKDIEQFRRALDDNLPTFYVVNTELISEEVYRSLNNVVYYVENNEYAEAQIKLISKQEIQNIVASTLSKYKSVAFLPIAEKIQEEYDNLLNGLSQTQAYVAYRRRAAKASFSVGTLLKKSIGKLSIVSDASSFVNVPSHSIVFVGITFEATKTDINKQLNEAIRGYVKSKADLTIKKYTNKSDGYNWSVGNLVNAGHTAAFSGASAIGINMPYSQAAQFRMSSAVEQAQQLESNLVKLYTKNNYQIDFKQEYKGLASCLLNLQFSFVISMPAAYNTNTLQVQETATIKKALEAAKAKELSEVIASKVAGGVLPLSDLSASPTLAQYIAQAVLDTITGKKPKALVKANKANKEMNSSLLVGVKKHKVNLKTKIKKVPLGKFPDPKPSTSILTSLQALLDSLLVQKVKENMGSGNARNVLNLRTGRLAESAKVERLSMSRNGMVTAFYSYMKNPYSTFSEGGRQQYPRTRDPKLLISKSIREIAATQVANRLRAVLV